MNAFCSQCNYPMTCTPGHDCWCAGLPPALPVPDQGTSGCLCPNCLTSKLESLRENYYDEVESRRDG